MSPKHLLIELLLNLFIVLSAAVVSFWLINSVIQSSETKRLLKIIVITVLAVWLLVIAATAEVFDDDR